MRIADVVHDSIVDGQGIRFTVFTQGCPHHCPGCHNPQTHDPAGGKEMSVDDLFEQTRRNPLLDGITLSGGEPFSQAAECAELARRVKESGLTVWVYTGYTLEFLLEEADPERLKLLRNTDVLVDGPFILKEKSLNLLWRGSKNQRLLDVPRSLEEKRPVEWIKPKYI